MYGVYNIYCMAVLPVCHLVLLAKRLDYLFDSGIIIIRQHWRVCMSVYTVHFITLWTIHSLFCNCLLCVPLIETSGWFLIDTMHLVPYPLRIKCYNVYMYISITDDVFIYCKSANVGQKSRIKKKKNRRAKCPHRVIHAYIRKYSEYIINYIANWGFIANNNIACCPQNRCMSSFGVRPCLPTCTERQKMAHFIKCFHVFTSVCDVQFEWRIWN